MLNSTENCPDIKPENNVNRLVAIVAAALAFINPSLWDLAFIMVPIFFMARKKLVNVKYFKLSQKKDSSDTNAEA